MKEISNKSFKREFLDSQGPVILMLSLSTCPYCISASRFIAEQKIVETYQGIKFLKFDIKDKKSGPEEFGEIALVPIFIFAYNGREVHRVLGGDKFKDIFLGQGIAGVFLEKTPPPVFK